MASAGSLACRGFLGGIGRSSCLALGAHFSSTFLFTRTEMYPCVKCGKVLRSQQSLNYHLAHKPATCEKYLRKLSNQEEQASMAITAQFLSTMATSATKIVRDDVLTSRLQKPSTQAARTIAPATQTPAEKSAVGNASPTQSAAVSAPLSLAAKNAVGNEVSLASPAVSSPSQQPVRTPARNNNLMSFQKRPEPRKLLAGESTARTTFDTDGYCWFAETGSSKKGRFYESCRCCSMYHSSDPSNVVAHIRTSKEMKCKCALGAPCECKKGPQPPLFVVSRCTGRRIRRTRRGVPSGEQALYEERDSHDSSFCKMNQVEMAAAVNKANMKAKARTAQSCQHLKTWQVRQAIEADHQIPYKLVGEPSS